MVENNGYLRRRIVMISLLLTLSAGASFAQTTSFTYQGRLTDGGTAANGNYDLQFALFDSLSGGAQVGSTQTLNTVAVSNGVFTVSLDFGASAFNLSVIATGNGATVLHLGTERGWVFKQLGTGAGTALELTGENPNNNNKNFVINTDGQRGHPQGCNKYFPPSGGCEMTSLMSNKNSILFNQNAGLYI